MYLWTLTCLPTWCIYAASLSKNGNKVVCEVFLPQMRNFCSHLRAVHPAPCSPMQPFGMVLADLELPHGRVISQLKFFPSKTPFQNKQWKLVYWRLTGLTWLSFWSETWQQINGSGWGQWGVSFWSWQAINSSQDVAWNKIPNNILRIWS